MEVRHDRDSSGMTTLAVEVPVELVDEVYQQAVRDLKRHVNVPGFRRGKVPPKLVESILGPEAITEYAQERLEERIVPDAFAEVPSLVPLDEAEVKLESFTRGEPARLTIKVLSASVELGEVDGLEVEQYRAEADGEAARAELEKYYESAAEYEPAEHQDVRQGDHVQFSLRIIRDGYLVEEYDQDEPLRIQLGNNALTPNLDEHLVGLSVGQEATFDITYPDDYDNEELRGAVAEFTVQILEIETREALEPFLQRVGQFDTVEAAIESLQERMREERAHMYRLMAREEAVRKAVENATIQIPSAYLEADVMDEIEEFEQALTERGVDLEGLEDDVMDREEERIRERVTFDTQRDVFLRALAGKINLEVTRDDIAHELSLISSYNRVEPRLMIKRLEESGELASVARSARLRLAAEHVFKQAKVSEVDPPADDESDEPTPLSADPLLADELDLDETAPSQEDEPCP